VSRAADPAPYLIGPFLVRAPTVVAPDEPLRIFRLLVRADDLGRARRFYESLLALRGRSVGGGRVYFDLGPVILGLLESRGTRTGADGRLPEPLYFATAELEEVHARARRLNCLSKELIHDDPANPAGEIVVRPWGERSFYAFDLSGNPLCFVDDGTLFTGHGRPVEPRERVHVDRRPADASTRQEGARRGDRKRP
jgi:hypothetical protein